MSRRSEEREKRREVASAERNAPAPPSPNFPSKRLWIPLLKPSKIWFSPEKIQALRELRDALKNKVERELLRAQLLAEGFKANEPTFVETDYYWALISAIWPPEVSAAIWDKGRALTTLDAEAIVRFLEINPMFFRSGYAKPIAIKRLSRCPLAADHPKRIAAILDRLTRAGWNESMPGWLRLVPLAEAEALAVTVRQALSSQESGPVRRATLIGLKLLGRTRELGMLRMGYPAHNHPWGPAIALVRAAFLRFDEGNSRTETS